MKPVIKGDQTGVSEGDLRRLIPRPLSSKDKGAFWLHVNEIEKMAKEDWPSDGWDWRKVVIRNYCNRTGVNFDYFVHLVSGKYWLHVQQALIDSKMV